ncbi:hypothetical protein NDA16_000150 [Ustilago loliicola]|nr:hypothetical protein NDA16_000150 [Ustilago loliicola]
MRQRRAKLYRKMLHQYHLQFGFREPYQLLIDDSFSLALSRYKIADPVHQFANVLVSKKIKPLITQCSMQALYALGKEAQSTVDMAKAWERRMCNHREALPTAECIKQCVGPENKHRYIVANEQRELRRDLRLNVPGLPMMHFTQAVMVLEPMSALTKSKIEEKEETKLSLPVSEAGLLKNQPKVEVDIIGGDAEGTAGQVGEGAEGGEKAEGAKEGESTRRRKRKAPNPLSMRKPKNPRLTMEEKLKREQELKKHKQRVAARARMEATKLGGSTAEAKAGAGAAGEGAKRKRKRSNKSSSASGDKTPAEKKDTKENAPTPKTVKPKTDANGSTPAPKPEASAPPKKRRSRGKNNSAATNSAAAIEAPSAAAAPAESSA